MLCETGHAYPPDIGQGVNAGLQDVVALDRALCNINIIHRIDDATSKEKTSTKTWNLGDALLAYQKNRGPEHAALIRIARFGGPYQYRQPWLRHRIGAMIWTMNFLFRTMVNKLSFGYISPPLLTLLSDPSLTYRHIMRRADITTFAFQFLLLTCVLRWILPRWSWFHQHWMLNLPLEMTTASLALIIVKGILPLKDRLESFMRRERYVGRFVAP
jgi:kynurenine 3-monooxygenase